MAATAVIVRSVSRPRASSRVAGQAFMATRTRAAAATVWLPQQRQAPPQSSQLLPMDDFADDDIPF